MRVLILLLIPLPWLIAGAAQVYAKEAPVITPPAGPVITPPEGSPVVTPPASTGSTNVTVNVTPPPPDPAATRAMYGFVIATTEFDHASVPVNWANDLLKGANIWTRTPADHFDNFLIAGMRNSAKNAAVSLFLLGILWTGLQLVVDSGKGTGSAMQLLPMLIAGFLMAVYADSIGHRAIDLNNWLCGRLAEPSLFDFTGEALKLPEQPDVTAPGVIAVPASFFSGLLTSLLYAVVLLILELKLIFREGVLIVTDVVMPISGALWAFQITRGWGLRLFQMFFGWLFGQPLAVVCLALGGTLLTLFNVTDSAAQILVKVAILFVALKAVSLFASGGLGSGGAFGLAGLLFLLRRTQGWARGTASSAAAASGGAPTAASPSAAVQSGHANGSGTGSAATGRPWRPAMGTA